jgi:peptidoglycan/LPS O-acetylase OafA/YrhL
VRSSTGEHYVALDHLRALAAFLVYCWHFVHFFSTEVRYDIPMVLAPLSLADQGHVGVALFMVLSGYLFAKLLDGREIDYFAFLRARFWRLAPLLAAVLLAVLAIQFWNYGTAGAGADGILFLKGFVLPVWPNGAWSITVEMHFYLMLPILLWLAARDLRWLLVGILAAMVLRLWLYLYQADIRDAVYFTMAGRFDQFAIGILAFHCRRWFAGSHKTAAAVFVAFSLFYWWFDMAGGFKGGLRPDAWIIMPTIEGLSWAAIIAYYDNTFRPKNTGWSGRIALVGTYSYSIYLLHAFVVLPLSLYVHRHIIEFSNIYIALACAVVGFLAMIPLGYLSFRFIEAPFLRNRRPYTKKVNMKPTVALLG